ncbi:MAG: hypothetical protein ACJ79K_05955 [Gemmatimonadaceae bacterium]
MLNRLALVTLLAALPTVPTIALAQGAAPPSAVCDGSQIRHAERMRNVGRTLFTATAVADLAAVLTIPRSPDGATKASSHFAFIGATAPVAFAGAIIAQRAHPGESFWQSVIARLKVGETSTTDVQLCLHRPDVRTSSTTGERWTYVTARPALFDGTLRSLRLTFRDSVLTNVEQTEVNRVADARGSHDSTNGQPARHRGYCMPPIPAVADPFPTPTDTTFAAAAMARAKADADAASKNAAAAATYAACMASDTAQ